VVKDYKEIWAFFWFDNKRIILYNISIRGQNDYWRKGSKRKNVFERWKK
jgi:hypothetical protein